MFKVIVAYCRNRGIGYRGSIPWKMTQDMHHFKKTTIGGSNNAIIMGKNTWLSLSKRPLPQRDNLILSTTLKEANCFSSITEIKSYCLNKKYKEVWIIGGQQIYEQFINQSDISEVCVTFIDNKYKCDTFFPEISQWFSLYNKSDFYKENGISFQYQFYGRPDRHL